FQPRLDVLEDRTLPSTFTVLNLNDNGAGSLRQAVLDANTNPGPDDVAFSLTLRGTITLTSGELAVTDELKINGTGTRKMTVDGNDTSRVFYIGAGVPVSISSLTITRGVASRGGGIRNAGGSLTLSSVVMSNNKAVGTPVLSAVGGAVWNDNGGTLAVSKCDFTGNQAVGGPGGFGFGGAIANWDSA